MLRYYFNGPASISLYERLQQILTCNMVRGMVIVNILIVFLISILDIILVNMPYLVGNLALIFIILCVYTGVITGVSGHWNKQKQRMELPIVISVLLVILSCICLVAFYHNVFVGIPGRTAYLIPFGMATIILLIAIVIKIMDTKYK